MVYAVPAKTVAPNDHPLTGETGEAGRLACLLTSNSHISAMEYQFPRQNPIGKVGPGSEVLSIFEANL